MSSKRGRGTAGNKLKMTLGLPVYVHCLPYNEKLDGDTDTILAAQLATQENGWCEEKRGCAFRIRRLVTMNPRHTA
ncbi:60S ribosomal protein L23A [Exophiala xenobiotica]|uniref:60S ribosomal protein L23A n=1 Tax=Lithohypha guttulata TaxID=1690604 RepID=A0ABR0KBY3_9EURO|nr:60S ribosomal protein L23A [Lithohypha guttulata]KAK5315424.1 60S ribosomal protein L23A [Exophiala xenobiotica]